MPNFNRVEIITSTLKIPELSKILDSDKVTGYTLIENLSGKGNRGSFYDDFGREFSNSYISAICQNQEQFNYLIDSILPILKTTGGLCLVTQSESIGSDQTPKQIDLVSDIMEEVKKIEIIIDTFWVEDITRILDSVSVTGQTIIKDTSGKDDRGLFCSDIGCSFSNSYIITVCKNEKQLNSLVEKITPILKKLGGVCLVTEAKWVNN